MSKMTNGLPLIYTLEANYASGNKINQIQKRYDTVNDLLIEEDPTISNLMSESILYCPAVWKDVGASLLTALLDYDCINPLSRIIQSKD